MSRLLIVAEVGVVMVLDRTIRDGHCPLAEKRKLRIPLLRFPVILTSPGNGAQASRPLGDVHADCLLEGLWQLAFASRVPLRGPTAPMYQLAFRLRTLG